MPPSIRRLEQLLIAMGVVMTIGMLWSMDHSRDEIARGGMAIGDGAILAVQGGFIAFWLAIGFLATRRVSKWARRLFKVGAVLMVLNPLLNAAAITKAGGWPFAIFFAAAGIGILLLARKPDAKAWFAAPQTGDGTPSVSDIVQSEISKHL